MEFKIQNMVGSCDVKFPIRLEGLVVKHSQFSRSAACCMHVEGKGWSSHKPHLGQYISHSPSYQYQFEVSSCIVNF